MDRLNKSDWTLIAICLAVAAISVLVVFNWFTAAFPEASIDFRYDRNASASIAERLLAEEHIDVGGMKHSAVFDGDDNAKIFLERSLGLARANGIMRRDVRRFLPDPLPHGMTIWDGMLWYCDDVGVVCRMKL